VATSETISMFRPGGGRATVAPSGHRWRYTQLADDGSELSSQSIGPLDGGRDGALAWARRDGYRTAQDLADEQRFTSPPVPEDVVRAIAMWSMPSGDHSELTHHAKDES
jgi:hypothetical protein